MLPMLKIKNRTLFLTKQQKNPYTNLYLGTYFHLDTKTVGATDSESMTGYVPTNKDDFSPEDIDWLLSIEPIIFPDGVKLVMSNITMGLLLTNTQANGHMDYISIDDMECGFTTKHIKAAPTFTGMYNISPPYLRGTADVTCIERVTKYFYWHPYLGLCLTAPDMIYLYYHYINTH